MAIKKQKTFKNKSTTSEFSDVGYISGGNTFETHVKLETQEQLDKIGLDGIDIGVIGNEIKRHVDKHINEMVPNWWIILQEQANYFCNQLQWDIDDTHLKSLIINVIRSAFYNGTAGIYYNDITNDFEAVVINNVTYNASSKIQSAKYILAHNYLSGIKDNITNKLNDLFTIPKSKIKNLAFFKWGTESLASAIRILPYVKHQHVLMKMLVVQKFAYNKKFVYNCNSPTAAKKEIELFFDPQNPFIINAGFGKNHKELENDFSEVSLESKSALDFIEFYKESMSIIYSQIGRRQNTDVKKERNVSSEVEASQENYDILLKDVTNQFEIFVDNANKIFKEHGMSEIILEQEENNNDVPEDISETDNQRMNNELL